MKLAVQKIIYGVKFCTEVLKNGVITIFFYLGNFANRSQPVTATVIQFSGIGPDSTYDPGTGGKVKNTELYHYKVELEPFNLSRASNAEISSKIKKLNSVEMIDGNGQLFLALQDVSMENFQHRIEKVLTPFFLEGTKIL